MFITLLCKTNIYVYCRRQYHLKNSLPGAWMAQVSALLDRLRPVWVFTFLSPALNGATCAVLIALRVTRALYEAWALLQKLLCLHYSNPVTAAFNYSSNAGSWGAKRDRGRQFGAFQKRKIKNETFDWGPLRVLQVLNHNGLEHIRGWKVERSVVENLPFHKWKPRGSVIIKRVYLSFSASFKTSAQCIWLSNSWNLHK